MDGWRGSWGSEAPVATGDGKRQETGQGQVTCCPRGEGAVFSDLDLVSSSLDGRAAGRGPPGDLCSPCEEGRGCGERRGQGGQEKYLRSRNNGLFSEVQPGLRDRLVGWRPVLPCSEHLQCRLPQPRPALGALHGPAWLGLGAPSSALQPWAHSWMHGSACCFLTRAGPLGLMAFTYTISSLWWTQKQKRAGHLLTAAPAVHYRAGN